ncbi:aldehyde dehydrogenase [Candidatus Peregrinibacteria bacterium]|jgi:glyceraldehyde 3-phosphate dehydrogenase|nr:aldehyde dehydrogenase [Candidatus Peregrinibacteria bacterium]
MKKIRVGINGFGRIGRAIFRINQQKQFFEVVAINDINPEIKNMAYLLRYDTTYGRFDGHVDHTDTHLVINDEKVRVYHQPKITDVPWDDLDIDIVIDSSGIKANLDLMLADDSGVKNYIVTNAPQDYMDRIQTIIFGVNDEECAPDKYKIFSSSICDTISMSPILKLIQETHKIESGFLTTLHPWLAYQNLVDGPSKSWSQPGDIYSNYSLGRASTQVLIPKSTSAVIAAEAVYPGLCDRLQSFSYRVPTAIVSSAVLILQLDKEIEKDEIMKRFEEYERTQEYNVIKNSMEPLTSIDYAGEEASVIIDQRWTKVENKTHLKMVYWYDNEWGYSCRAVDLVRKIAESY